MSIDDLKEIVEQFGEVRVLVTGDLILDKFIQGTVSRISPEAPVAVVDVVSEMFRPGGATKLNKANDFSQSFLYALR